MSLQPTSLSSSEDDLVVNVRDVHDELDFQPKVLLEDATHIVKTSVRATVAQTQGVVRCPVLGQAIDGTRRKPRRLFHAKGVCCHGWSLLVCVRSSGVSGDRWRTDKRADVHPGWCHVYDA
uniref:Uncharacterized protein n=1 Tax=Hyaloperonospora arabidopsidis (strain Emoy2) TaxID=559515 RepID=M4BXK2_HYAAE